MRKTWILSTSAALVVAGLLFATHSASASSPAPSPARPAPTPTASPKPAAAGSISPELTAAVSAALTVDQTLVVPSVTAPAAKVATAMSGADIAAVQTTATRRIAATFKAGSAVATTEAKAVQNAAAMEAAGNFRVLAAGIKGLALSKGTVTGNAATATGVVETWSRFSMADQNGAWQTYEPHNKLNFTMTLEKTATGAWIVDSYDWTFVPGTGP